MVVGGGCSCPQVFRALSLFLCVCPICPCIPCLIPHSYACQHIRMRVLHTVCVWVRALARLGVCGRRSPTSRSRYLPRGWRVFPLARLPFTTTTRRVDQAIVVLVRLRHARQGLGSYCLGGQPVCGKRKGARPPANGRPTEKQRVAAAAAGERKEGCHLLSVGLQRLRKNVEG